MGSCPLNHQHSFRKQRSTTTALQLKPTSVKSWVMQVIGQATMPSHLKRSTSTIYKVEKRTLYDFSDISNQNIVGKTNRAAVIFIFAISYPTTSSCQQKILEVTFYPLLTCKQHARNIRDELQSKNNILKALAGSTHKDKANLKLFCTNFCTKTQCNHNWQVLLRAQNSVLRTIAGCHKLSSDDHLHQEKETNILRIKYHKIILVDHSNAITLHPNQVITTLPDPPRKMRKSAK